METNDTRTDQEVLIDYKLWCECLSLELENVSEFVQENDVQGKL